MTFRALVILALIAFANAAFIYLDDVDPQTIDDAFKSANTREGARHWIGSRERLYNTISAIIAQNPDVDMSSVLLGPSYQQMTHGDAKRAAFLATMFGRNGDVLYPSVRNQEILQQHLSRYGTP